MKMNKKGEKNNFSYSSIFLKSRKGQGLSVNAIIMIVLGVFVLAVLILGFTMGWGNIKDRIAPSNNVKTIADACSLACNTNSQFDFCTYSREIKMDSGSLESINTVLVEGVDKLKSGDKKSCNEFVKYSKLGITSCPAVPCSSN